MKAKLRGFRVCLLSDKTTRKGIACDSLQMLKLEIERKFNLKSSPSIRVFLTDGTEIDDEEYFTQLPLQSTLIVSSDNSSAGQIKSISNPYAHFASVCHDPSALQALRAIKEFLVDNSNGDINQERWKLMQSFLEMEKQEWSTLSTKDDDPNWFANLSTNAKTKEEFMEKSCQGRIRGYLSKAEAQIRQASMNGEYHFTDFLIKMEEVVKEFRHRLKTIKFNGHFFNRKSELPDKMCDSFGNFVCEGRYNLESCQNFGYEKAHTINPYESAEKRILFSTWNLDHVIERSRSVVPALIKALAERQNRLLNIEYFHQLLFTRKNLKLVHIVCHDKQEHKLMKCDPKKFYLCDKILQKKATKVISTRLGPHLTQRAF